MGWPRQDSHCKNSVLRNQTQVHSDPNSDTLCSSEILLSFGFLTWKMGIVTRVLLRGLCELM